MECGICFAIGLLLFETLGPGIVATCLRFSNLKNEAGGSHIQGQLDQKPPQNQKNACKQNFLLYRV